MDASDLMSTAAESMENAKATVSSAASAAASGAGMATALPADATRMETVLISYFRIFVYALFPPAGVLLMLLMTPLPRSLQKSVVNLCDGVLFWQPHASVPLSLYTLVVGISALTLLVVLQDLFTLRDQYAASTDKPERTLVRILAEERNAWISASCIALWSIAHRYRSLMRKYHDAVSDASSSSSSSSSSNMAKQTVEPPALMSTSRLGGLSNDARGGIDDAAADEPQQQQKQEPMQGVAEEPRAPGVEEASATGFTATSKEDAKTSEPEKKEDDAALVESKDADEPTNSQGVVQARPGSASNAAEAVPVMSPTDVKTDPNPTNSAATGTSAASSGHAQISSVAT